MTAIGMQVSGLTVEIDTPRGTVRAVDDVSFTAHRGRTLALLGESGCGKSMTAQAVAGLLEPIAEATAGTVEIDGEDLLSVSRKRRRELAGRQHGQVAPQAVEGVDVLVQAGQPHPGAGGDRREGEPVESDVVGDLGRLADDDRPRQPRPRHRDAGTRRAPG